VSNNVVVFNASVEMRLFYHLVFEARQFEVLDYGQTLTTLDELAALSPALLIIDGVRAYVPADLDFLDSLSAYPALVAVPLVITTTALPGTLDLNSFNRFPNHTVLVQPFIYHGLMEAVTRALQAGAAH
jgi:FixJ family two-component response regulator